MTNTKAIGIAKLMRNDEAFLYFKAYTKKKLSLAHWTSAVEVGLQNICMQRCIHIRSQVGPCPLIFGPHYGKKYGRPLKYLPWKWAMQQGWPAQLSKHDYFLGLLYMHFYLFSLKAFPCFPTQHSNKPLKSVLPNMKDTTIYISNILISFHEYPMSGCNSQLNHTNFCFDFNYSS